MDATQNDSAIAADPETAAQDAVAEPVAEPTAETSEAVETAEAAAQTPEASEEAADSPAEDVPAPRAAEPEPAKTKKRKAAPKSKTAAGTKSLVVFREGRVHYADETVVVLDLDDAAHPDTDVHDVVDKLSELRDAVESPGRAEAVSLVAELIQTKALA